MLNARKLGLSAGILWGISMFVLTLISIGTGYAEGFLSILSGIYPGYDITLGGSFIGLVYGFFDGFIGFWILATIYNKLK